MLTRIPTQDVNTMATPATDKQRPGLRVGPTSEFSLFFRVRPGHEQAVRDALTALRTTPTFRVVR